MVFRGLNSNRFCLEALRTESRAFVTFETNLGAGVQTDSGN